MSLPAIVWVLKHSEATLGSRLVLIVLAEFAHDDGSNAFPSVKTISERARMSDRAVRSALRRLEGDGLVEATGKSEHRTIVYRILGLGGEESSPRKKTTVKGEDSSGGGGSSRPSEGEVSSSEPTTKPTTEPSVTPSTEIATRTPSEATPRPANPIWDVIVEIHDEPLPRYAAARGRIVADLRELLVRDGVRDADQAVEEIRRRSEALSAEWGEAKATARALVQHWSLAGKLADGRAKPRKQTERYGRGLTTRQTMDLFGIDGGKGTA